MPLGAPVVRRQGQIIMIERNGLLGTAFGICTAMRKHSDDSGMYHSPISIGRGGSCEPWTQNPSGGAVDRVSAHCFGLGVDVLSLFNMGHHPSVVG